MGRIEQIERRAEKEVEMTERDESLTNEEKDRQIREIYREANEMIRDLESEDYNER